MTILCKYDIIIVTENLFKQAPSLWQEGEHMYYYVTILNYTQNGLERTLILNPNFSREEIKRQMEKEKVAFYLIQQMEQEGIFLDREIAFKVERQMLVYWEQRREDGSLVKSHERRFGKKDEVTFHVDESYSWKYYYTPFEKIQMFCAMVPDKVKALFSSGQN